MKSNQLLVNGLALSVFLALGFFAPLKAQEATDESKVIVIEKNSASPAPAETTTQILQNLERLAKDSSQSEQIKEQYDGVTSKTRGIIAQVVSLKSNSFKIVTPQGEELIITPDKSTTIVKKGQSDTGDHLTLSEWIAIDDWLVLIGIQNGDIFSPRRILVSSESLSETPQFVLRGTIKTATSSKIDLLVAGQNDAVETLALDKNVNLVNRSNETITYQDLSSGTAVLLTGGLSGDTKKLKTLRVL